MKLTILIMTVFLLQVSASSNAQITIKAKQESLRKVLKDINKQSGYDFVYSDQILKSAVPVDLQLDDASIESALQAAFKDQPLMYEVSDKTVMVRKKDEKSYLENILARFQSIDVRGRVVDKEGNGIMGATVSVKGTNKSVSSGTNGFFTLKSVEENSIVTISFIGYGTKELKAGENLGDVILALSDNPLDEVQIMAYGQTSRRLSTGNISTVKAEDIAKAPVGNPLLAIAGRVPGVYIQQSSGMPGSGVKVIIQGQNSINGGNDPFYVIDGVPYTSQLLPGLGVGSILGQSGPGLSTTQQGTNGNPLNFLNIQDIESIDILKDADATSIYGTRAANGAIIITTKKGSVGKVAVNVNASQGIGTLASKVKLLNTAQYLQMRREAFANSNTTVPTDPSQFNASNYDLTYWDQNRFTDWQDELIGGNAKYTNILTSISGGNINTQYLFSGGFLREGTVTPGDLRDQKASLHFNLNSSSDNKKFKFSFSGSYIDDDNDIGQIATLISDAFTLPPNAPNLYNSDGTLNFEYINPTTTTFTNSLTYLKRGYVNKTNNLISNVILSYELLKGLEIRNNFGYTKLQSNEISTNPSGASAPHLRATRVRTAQYNSAEIVSWIVEPQLTYRANLWKGKIEGLIGSTFQSESRDRQQLNASGFSSDESMYNLKAASNVIIDSAPNAVILSEYRYNGFFGRLNYNIDDRYILSISARRDGSSRFGKENRFHNFASVAGAWIFSNEKYIKEKLDFLSFGKFKISYGSTGNDQIGDYSYLNLYGNAQTLGVDYQGIRSLEPFEQAPNPYLQWEETRKLSGALDFGFFNDRILLNTTYYRNRSSNQLSGDVVSTVTGYSSINRNFPGLIQNTGWEIGLNTQNLKSAGFNWYTSFNITIPRNKLLKASNSVYDEFLNMPLGMLKVYHFMGVDPITGLYTVADKNGIPTSTPDPNTDKTVLINLNPKFFGGFQNTFNYKQFSLDVLFQFTNQKASEDIFGLGMPGAARVNQRTNILNRWQKVGDQAEIQKFVLQGSESFNIASASDRRFSDASFARLKNLSFSYQFDPNWIEKYKIKSAKIYIQGQNLLTITNYLVGDPENRSINTLPPLKVLTLGVQLSL